MERDAYTIAEAAEQVRVGRTQLFQEIKSGRLQARKIGARTIILRGDLLSYLNALPKVEPGADRGVEA